MIKVGKYLEMSWECSIFAAISLINSPRTRLSWQIEKPSFLPYMKTVKIFLASSGELFLERDMMLKHVTKLNRSFEQRGITIKLVRWEELEGSVSRDRKQNEYNE